MRLSLSIFLLWTFTHVLSVPIQGKVSYFGYSVIRVTPVSNSQLQYLLNINSNSSIGIDFWLRTTRVNHPADVMVSPSAKEFFVKGLSEKQIPYQYLIKDIGKLIEDDTATVVPDPNMHVLTGFFAQYNRYSEILNFISLLSENYPEFVTALEIGRSFENRPLMLLKISTSEVLNKPIIWVQGGAHAREFIGPAAVIYFALQLVAGFGQDPKINAIVDAFDWYILPVLNPDGYEYAHTTDRLWRKTRSINPLNPECIGVDANRNWDLAWSGAAGSSRDPCSHNYGGTHPFSEPETRSVSNFMLKRLKRRLLLFLDMHSYSQRWLTPWGYTTTLPPNYEAQIIARKVTSHWNNMEKQLAETATASVEKVYGTKFTVGSSAGSLYTVSGGARDWVYGVAGAEYSYVVELRDKGNYGFVLNRAQILPTAEETWAGVLAMACQLAKPKNLTGITKSFSDSRNTTRGYAYGIAVFWRF